MKIVTLFVLMVVPSTLFANPYIGVQGGALMETDELKTGSILNVRVGKELTNWDLSLDYLNYNSTVKSSVERFAPGDIDLKTLSALVYYRSTMRNNVSVKLGGGIGHTFASHAVSSFVGREHLAPVGDNLYRSDVHESLNDGISYTISTGLEYSLNKYISLGMDARYVLFRTKVNRHATYLDLDRINDLESHTQVAGSADVNLDSFVIMAGIKLYIF